MGQFSGQFVTFVVVKAIDKRFRKNLFDTPNLLDSVYFTDQNIFYSYQRDDPIKCQFWPFSNSKIADNPNRGNLKRREEKWDALLSFLVLFLSYGPWNVKNGPFFKTFTTASNQYGAPEKRRYALSRNGMGYQALGFYLRYISSEKYRIFFNF